MRLVFAGTPEVAVPSLDALLGSRHDVAAVLTRPDAPAGRGLRPAPSPVARRAAAAGLETLRPDGPGDQCFLDRLSELAPDCCAVTAYGARIPRQALVIPVHGWVNLHFSLLPAWRGAAPVQHAILHGDEVTGATTFQIVEELDAGPVFGVLTEPVRPTDTAGALLERLSQAGAGLLAATLDGIESGELTARPQSADGISRAPKITPADAQVRWKLPALAIDRLIRSCTPVPGAWTTLYGGRVKLWPLAAPSGEAAGPGGAALPGAPRAAPDGAELIPGQLRAYRSGVLVGTGTVPVWLGDVQPDGKRRMNAADWLRGLRLAGRDAVLG